MIKHRSDDAFDLPAGQSFACRINSAAERLRRLRVFLVEHKKLRIGHLQLMPVQSHLPRGHDDLTRFQLAAKIPAVEPHYPANARIVADHSLEKRLPALTLVVNRLDQAKNGYRLVRLHLAYPGRFRAKIPIPRKNPQQT